ncbi:hypothetical protein NPA08_03965 [Mycoplasmopsis citelli]|nr:hypothetical protein [Mycoplasmopsis citelli]UUD36082.1 hypothetical protein NPA08_03965 [Mycoplasmopsis citelli]
MLNKARSLAKILLITALLNFVSFILLIVGLVLGFSGFIGIILVVILIGPIVFAISGITSVVLYILLVIRINDIKAYYLTTDPMQSESYNTLFTLSIVGFFVPFVSIVLYFMVLSKTSESLGFSK